MSENSVCGGPSSPPATLPDNDDILGEILLRLPPLPSSFPRASLVCKRWRRLLSDPSSFHRRFRAFHRRSPPLLGFFIKAEEGLLHFIPTLGPPDRIPSGRFSLQVGHGDKTWSFLGCRHGLALILNLTDLEVTVWDPLAGDQRRVPTPPGWFRNQDPLSIVCNGGLHRDHHHAGGPPLDGFKVVLVHSLLDGGDPQLLASVYDSETGVWGDLVTTAISAPVSMVDPSVLVGNSLYWLLQGYESDYCSILEFDLGRQALAVIDVPEGMEEASLEILRMEDNGLGLAILSPILPDVTIQLWKREPASSDGATRWMLQESIELDRFLSVGYPIQGSWTFMHGYDEDCHVLFISTALEAFMIQLKSMQFRNVYKITFITAFYPYTGFYTTGGGIGALAVEDLQLEPGTLNST